jgi:TetR/AcrR family transcriptional regulator, cholesterol catabolism regulator
MEKDWARFNKKDWNKIAEIGKIAAKLFYEKGYIETSIDDIAVSVKMTKGGIYYYFKTKNEILYFVLDHYVNFFLENLEKELKKINDPFLKIKFIISRHIDFYYKNLPEGKVLLHEVHCLLPEYFSVIAKKERKYLNVVAGVLSGYFGKHIPKDQLKVITFCLFGMCNWIYSWYDPKGPVHPQNLAKIIYSIFSVGVRQLNEFKKTMA